MGMSLKGFTAVRDGIEYVSIGIVAETVGKSVQTIRLWSDWSDEQESKGFPRYIPAPKRIGSKGIRCFDVADIPKIQEFSNTIKYGTLSRYNRKQWGKRGKVRVDKSIENRSK